MVTPVGSVPEVIVQGINGVVVGKDQRQVVQAFERIEQNREWARGMGEQARQYALKYGHARLMAERYAKLFEKLTGRAFSDGEDSDRMSWKTMLRYMPYGQECPYDYGLPMNDYGICEYEYGLPQDPNGGEYEYGQGASCDQSSA